VTSDLLHDAMQANLTPLPRPRRLVSRLERVYTTVGSGLAMRHHLDRYDEITSGPPAHGIEDDDLRSIASFLLTAAEGRWRRLARSLPHLWRRGGREHRRLTGMLLANLPNDALGEDRWTVLSSLLQSDVGLAAVAEAAEEVRRAAEGPSDEWLDAMAAQSHLWHRYAAVIAMTGDPAKASEDLVRLVRLADGATPMFERLRERWMERHLDSRQG
jgi:hypothetical protein